MNTTSMVVFGLCFMGVEDTKRPIVQGRGYSREGRSNVSLSLESLESFLVIQRKQELSW